MANVHAQATAEREASGGPLSVLGGSGNSTTPVFMLNIVAKDFEEGFIRERDRAAVAELVLADTGVLLRQEQAMVSEF